jgi:hypothetical protein
MPTKKKPEPPAKTSKTPKTSPEEPRLYTADIYVDGHIVSSVSLKAGSDGAAQIAVFRLIKVKVK